MGSWGNQSPEQVNTFGAFPNDLARQINRNLLRPLTNQLGWGHGQGPLAGLVNDIKTNLPGVFTQSNANAQQFNQMLPEATNAVRSVYGSTLPQLGFEANRALGENTNLLASGRGAIQSAQTMVDQAFNPMQSRATYQEALRQATEPLRQAQAARGVLSSGDALAAQSDIARNLAFQTAQTDQANQASAIQTLLGTLGNQAGLNTQGLGALGAVLSGAGQAQGLLGNLGQLANMGINNQLGTYGNVLQLLTAGLSPGVQLTGATAPVVGQSGKTGRVL